MSIAGGTKLGRYEVRSKIGAGGMGEVYLAQDMQLGRTVALKILPPDVASDQKRMQRFVQEAKSASALNHPNIPTVYEIGETDTAHFIATEYIEGETLRQRLSSAWMNLNVRRLHSGNKRVGDGAQGRHHSSRHSPKTS